MNGGVIASGQAVSALFSNPANLAAAPLYHVEALVDLWPQADRQTYGGGIVDSMTSEWGLAMGFGGAYTRIDNNDYGGGVSPSADGYGLQDTDLRLAMAFPFSKSFRLGVVGRYVTIAQSGEGSLAPSPASGGLPGQEILADVTVGAGVSIEPIDHVIISGVANNLTNPGNGFLPLTVGGGLAVVTQVVAVEVDLVSDLTTYLDPTYTVTGGVELLLAEYFPIRASYGWEDGTDTQSLGMGLGYSDLSFTADVGVRQTVVGPTSTTVGVGLTMRLEGTSAFN